MAKARDMGIITGHQQLLRKKKGISLSQKIKSLYDTLKDYRDAKELQYGGGAYILQNNNKTLHILLFDKFFFSGKSSELFLF
jgi:hypothetical protein